MTQTNEAVRAGGTKGRWLGVFSLLIIVLISYIDRVNVSVLITDHAFTEHFGMTGDRVLQGALMTVFLVGYGIAAFALTPLYESALGVRRGLLVSVATWSLLTLVSPYAFAALGLVVIRFLLGTAEGPLFSLKTMYIRDRFADHEVGKPNAISSMGVSLGTAVGLPLVTFLVYHFDWRSSYLLLGLLNAVVGIPLIVLFIRVRRRNATAAPDERAPATGWSLRNTWATLRTALRTPKLVWILLIEIATLAYLWGSSSWLPSYLLEEQHFSLAQMGVVSSLPFLMSLGSGFLGGYLIDRLRPVWVPALFVVGSIGTALSVVVVISMHTPWTAVVGLVLANGFWGLQAPAIPTLIQHHARPGTVGTAYGVINGVGNLVSAFMPALMGVVIGAGGAHGFAAGYSLLIGTQAVTLSCGTILVVGHLRGDRRAPTPAAPAAVGPDR